MTVWVVGKTLRDTDDGAVWELQGVFTSAVLAEEVARGGGYWLAPIGLDEVIPDQSLEWPGQRWPDEVSDG